MTLSAAQKFLSFHLSVTKPSFSPEITTVVTSNILCEFWFFWTLYTWNLTLYILVILPSFAYGRGGAGHEETRPAGVIDNFKSLQRITLWLINSFHCYLSLSLNCDLYRFLIIFCIELSFSIFFFVISIHYSILSFHYIFIKYYILKTI